MSRYAPGALAKALATAWRTTTSGRLFDNAQRTRASRRFSTVPSDDPSRDDEAPQPRRTRYGGGQYSLGSEHD